MNTVIALKLAQQTLGDVPAPATALVDAALAQAEDATRELRELAHGILPSALTCGGLRAGICALLARVDMPVSVEVTAERLPAALEATAYFIVAEALTNTIKHAHAGSAHVAAIVDEALEQARLLGMPDYRMLYIPHPVQLLTLEELHARAGPRAWTSATTARRPERSPAV